VKNIKIFKKLRDKIDTLKHKKIINFFKILALLTDRIAEEYCFIAEALIFGWRSLW
jgi:hypothetical protein